MNDNELPYAAGSETSKQAADSMRQRAPRDRERVLEYIRQQGDQGSTCDEVERALGMTHQSASARVHDLGRDGEIVDSDFRRKTRSGRNATVWKHKDA